MKIAQLLAKENNNLDLIRIILACMVIIGHTPALNGPTAIWADPIGYFFPFTYSGSLAVKLFFFISGLVVTNSYLKKRDPIYFLISRFFRIIPALFFILLITVFVFGPLTTTLSTMDYFSNLDNFSYITNNLIFTTAYYLPGVFNNNTYPSAVNGSLWSLRYEIGCYLFLLANFLLLDKRNKNYLNIPIFIIILASLYPNSFIFDYLGYNLEISLLPLSFALGCFLAVNAEKITLNYFMLLGSFALLYLLKDSPFNQILLLVTFAILVINLCTNSYVLKLRPKHDISYGIYLWGFLIQQTLFYSFGTMYASLHFFSALIISILFSLVSYICIEKPFITIGKNVFLAYQNKLVSYRK